MGDDSSDDEVECNRMLGSLDSEIFKSGGDDTVLGIAPFVLLTGVEKAVSTGVGAVIKLKASKNIRDVDDVSLGNEAVPCDIDTMTETDAASSVYILDDICESVL